jgi:hypothetical protein
MMITVILRGEFRSTVTKFNDNASEITVYGDVNCNGEEYRNLPLVRLIVELIDCGDEDSDVMVTDEYSSFIPYLKPIKTFREALGQELQRLYKELGYPANSGIKEYLEQLRSFSEIKSLVREVKSRVNRLRPEKSDPVVVRKIFVALGENPSMDNRFIVNTK